MIRERGATKRSHYLGAAPPLSAENREPCSSADLSGVESRLPPRCRSSQSALGFQQIFGHEVLVFQSCLAKICWSGCRGRAGKASVGRFRAVCGREFGSSWPLWRPISRREMLNGTLAFLSLPSRQHCRWASRGHARVSTAKTVFSGLSSFCALCSLFLARRRRHGPLFGAVSGASRMNRIFARAVATE